MKRERPLLPDEPADPENQSHAKPENTLEREPISYEQAFAAARLLHDKGVKDPYRGEYKDKALQSAWDAIEEWKRQRNIHIAGRRTTEEAADIVRYEMLWMNVGYANAAILHGTKENLEIEHGVAQREGSEEAARIIGDALQDVQAKLEKKNPEEKISRKTEKGLETADDFIRDGRRLAAYGTLCGILKNEEARKTVDPSRLKHYIDVMSGIIAENRLPENKDLAEWLK